MNYLQWNCSNLATESLKTATQSDKTKNTLHDVI